MADTPPPRPPETRFDVATLLSMLDAQNGPKTWQVDPATARMMFNVLAQMADEPVGELAVQRDLIAPGPAGDIPVRLFDCRAERGPGPVVVFFHGGGFVVGNVAAYAGFCAEISRALDLPVVSVEYRLAPEHPFPAAPDDAEAAARWVASNPADLGRPATGLILAGDSAGGNLTIVTTQALRDRPAAVPVLVQWPIYPLTDATRRYNSIDAFREGFLLDVRTMAWFTDHYGAPADDLRVSPLNANHHGTPPTLVLTAGLDPLRDQGRAYAAALIDAGVPTVLVEAPGLIHGFVTLRRAIPSGKTDLAACFAHLRALIAAATATATTTDANDGAPV